MGDSVGASEDGNLEPIAICGMACKLPGAIDSASSLWEMLKNKGSGQTPKVPASRFNIDAHYHKNLERPGSFNVLGGYFLDKDIESFDPTFFNMTPIEAMWLDPQQRKMLEVTYEALENAGLSMESVAGQNCAVFVGSFTADYQQMSTKDPDFRHNYAATGVDPGIISNRIGNVFNLKGPSFTINTACSSSVYATHMACHALRARDCEAALVGGVNLILTVDQHMNTAKLGILSPTSTCHTFDASADGYGRAEGAGALYLKRLSDAIRDGDPVRGVIRSSAVNTNGKVAGMGITHPSMKGQERAVRQAYERARLDPNKTAYLECHGTGTPVGDPIEVRAVSNAMNDTRDKNKPLLIGAIKANIGHSEAASGIFAIMKAAMMTEAAVIPGVCGLKNLNPAIHEEEWNIKVNVDTKPWPKGFASRRAGVSSFGYGGTNGHVIVEDVTASYPFYMHGKAKTEASYNHSTTRPLLVSLSAHDKNTLTKNIEAHAKVADRFYLADLAHTLNTKRTRFVQRAFTVATEGSVAEDFAVSNFKFGSASKKKIELGFILTGQGAQWAQMGAEAIKEFPQFQKTIRDLDVVLKSSPNPPSWSMEEELLAPAETSRIGSAEIAQPALTAVQIAIVDLFASWDIIPSVTVGHSSGEMGAAYAAGLTSAPEAMLAAYYRGYALAHHAPSGGTMLAIGLGAEGAAKKIPSLGQDPEVACENSPSSTTLSGSIAAIKQTKEQLDADGIFARELRTGQAYHSSHMKVVAPPFVDYLSTAYQNLTPESMDWRQPTSRMISSVTAKEITADEITPTYWASNLTNRVRFNEAVAVLGKTEGLEDVRCMVEVGPHSALAGPFKQICKENEFDRFAYTPSLLRGQDSAVSLLKTAGELFVQGYPVDLEQVNASEQMSPSKKDLKPLTLVDLPPYQWQYERTYWTEPRLSAEQRQLTHARHDILGSKIVGLSDRSLAWRNVLRHRDLPWLKDHKLGNADIFPAAGHLSLAIEAVRQICENKGTEIGGVTLRDVDIKTALVVPDTDDGIEIQVRINQTEKTDGVTTRYYFSVESLTGNAWTLHCEGTICPIIGSANALKDSTHPVNKAQLTQRVPPKRWYSAFNRVGFEYGPSFQKLGPIRTNNKYHSAAADVKVTTESGIIDGESRYILHPSTVDACLQLIIISIHAGQHKEMPWGVVPIGIEEVSLYLGGKESLGSAVAWTDELDGRYFNTHTKLEDADGNLVLDVKGLRCVTYEAAIPQNAKTEIIRQPYAGVSWKPDISTLTVAQAIQAYPDIASAADTITKTVELVDHKSPLTSILVLGLQDEGVLETVVKGLPAATTITIAESSPERLNQAKDQFQDRITALELPDSSLDLSSFDATYGLVLVGKEVLQGASLDTVLAAIKPLLAAKGKLIFSLDGGAIATAEDKLVASEFAPSELRFDLPDVTVIMSSLTPHINGAAAEKDQITVVTTNTQEPMLSELRNVMSKECAVVVKLLKDFDVSRDKSVIVADCDGKLIENIDPENFGAMKELLCSGTPTLWLTAGVNKGVNVSGGMAQGFLRTVRAEQSKAKITLLDVDHDNTIDAIGAAAFEKLQTVSYLESGADTEYWLHNGITYINRVVPNDELNAHFNTKSQPALPTVLEPGRALHGKVVGGEIIFEEDSQLIQSGLSSSELEIQVECFSMEGAASLASNGTPKLVAGQISKVGQGLSSSLVGQKALAYVSEALSTVVRIPAAQCTRFSQQDSATLLATLPSLSKAVNAIGYSRLNSNEHVVLVKPTPAIEEVFSKISRATGFKLSIADGKDAKATRKLISEVANGQAMTVVAHEFTSICQDIWRYMPAMSRFIVNESAISEAPDTLPFTRGVSFASTNLTTLHKRDANALAYVLQQSLELAKAHPELLTQSPKVIDISAAATTTVPSTVVSYGHNSSTINIRPSGKELRLSPDAAYLLVGCLGGLGRSLTSLMMERGAKDFVFLSRSGTDKAEAAHLVESLKEAGAKVQVYRADASSEGDVANVVAEVSSTRPIRGVVHAAMVLQDAMFGHTMTFDMFKAAIAPKVKGAQALHNSLHGHNLDFFVMTSSISATMGNPGQTNYSAANSYLDHLAWYRNLNGLPATSLILPMVLDVGVVAENETIETKITRKGWYGIDESEMLRGFETAMLQPVPKQGEAVTLPNAQIVLGVEPEFFAAAIAAAADTSDVYWFNDARFAGVRRAVEEVTKGAGTKKAAAGDFMAIFTVAQKEGGQEGLVQAIADYLMKKCSSILMVPVEDFEFDSGSIASYGLDSMIGAELRNWLFKEFGLDMSFQHLLAATLTFKGLSITVGQALGIIEA